MIRTYRKLHQRFVCMGDDPFCIEHGCYHKPKLMDAARYWFRRWQAKRIQNDSSFRPRPTGGWR